MVHQRLAVRLSGFDKKEISNCIPSKMFAAVICATIFLAVLHGGECGTFTWTLPADGNAAAPATTPEGTASAVLFTLAGTSDATPTTALTYALLSGTGVFSIDTATGAVTNTAELDYETAPSYVIYASGTDVDSVVSTCTVTLSVTDVTTDPTFPSIANCIILGDASSIGTAVSSVTATDPDGDTLAYTLDGNTNTDFAISSTTGAVTTAKIVYATNSHSYTLVIKAADASQTATTTLSVCVGTTSQCAACGSSSAAVMVASVVTMFAAMVLVLLQ